MLDADALVRRQNSTDRDTLDVRVMKLGRFSARVSKIGRGRTLTVCKSVYRSSVSSPLTPLAVVAEPFLDPYSLPISTAVPEIVFRYSDTSRALATNSMAS